MKIKKTISTHNFLALLLIIIIISANTLSVQAATPSTDVLTDEFKQTDNHASNTKMAHDALNIAKDFSGFSDISINKHRYINENVAVVEFEHDDSDFGYVLFKKIDNEFIPTEFVIDEDIDYSSYLMSFMSSDFEEYESTTSFFVQKREGTTMTNTFHTLSKAVRIPSSTIKNLTGKYACTVLAFTEIVEQNNLLRNNSRAETFNQLWEDTNTKVLYIKDDITYGKTYEFYHISGMKKYVEREGKHLSTESMRSPDFSFFVNSIIKGHSCCLSYTVNTIDGKVGHSVSVFSTYCNVTSDMKYYNYLGIADGATAVTKFILYNDFDYTYAYAISFNIY